MVPLPFGCWLGRRRQTLQMVRPNIKSGYRSPATLLGREAPACLESRTDCLAVRRAPGWQDDAGAQPGPGSVPELRSPQHRRARRRSREIPAFGGSTRVDSRRDPSLRSIRRACSLSGRPMRPGATSWWFPTCPHRSSASTASSRSPSCHLRLWRRLSAQDSCEPAAAGLCYRRLRSRTATTSPSKVRARQPPEVEPPAIEQPLPLAESPAVPAASKLPPASTLATAGGASGLVPASGTI